MTGQSVSRRRAMQHLSAAMLAGSAMAAGARPARAAGTVQMISHRYPALEYYAEKMRTAIPGVDGQHPADADRQGERSWRPSPCRRKADTLDIVYASDSTVLKFVKNGWLRPLDDLWAKYRDEFNLDDFPESVLQDLSL